MKLEKTATLPHYDVEMTDTYGGQANYGWVTRKALIIDDNASDLAIVRRAKKALGINGVRCKTDNFGDMISMKIHNACVIAFIHYCDNPDCYYLEDNEKYMRKRNAARVVNYMREKGYLSE